MAAYLLLMRHGSVDRDTVRPEPEQGLTLQGIQESYEVAKALHEHLTLLPDKEKMDIRDIRYSPYRHANQTAGALYDIFARRGKVLSCRECPDLAPSSFWPNRNTAKSTAPGADLRRELDRIAVAQESGNAIVIVGHEPQLGWIAHELLGKPLPPAMRSGIHCLRFESPGRKSGRHLWSISPTDPETLAALREKIKSKMTAAGQLGAFIMFLLGIALGILADRDKLDKLIRPDLKIIPALAVSLPAGLSQPIQSHFLNLVLAMSIGSLFCAMGLYLTAMYAYDRLLMPTPFWIQSRGRQPDWIPERPPSSAAWILYVNMMRVWKWVFTPATFAVVIGLLGMAEVVFQIHPVDFLALVIPAAVLAWIYLNFTRPRLGAED